MLLRSFPIAIFLVCVLALMSPPAPQVVAHTSLDIKGHSRSENHEDKPITSPPPVYLDETTDPLCVPLGGGVLTFTLRVVNISTAMLTLISLVNDVYGNLDGIGTCLVPQTILPGAEYECNFDAEVSGDPEGQVIDSTTARVQDEEGKFFEARDHRTICDYFPWTPVFLPLIWYCPTP